MSTQHVSGGGQAGRFGSSGHVGRRGAVVVQVAVMLTVLVGFMALVIDVGHLYNVRAQLQRTADAAALAAVADLGAASADPQQAARDEAVDFARRNRVLKSGVELELSDVVFGRAVLDEETGRYDFTVGDEPTNAVRVRVRRTKDSPSGSVSLFFASIFGITSADVSAQATAMIMPRDIAMVLDLSTSHNDDSSLRSFRNTEIANKDVYDWLTDTDSAMAARVDSLGFRSEISLNDNFDGTTTVTVALTSEASPQALSHVTFGLPPGAQALVEATATTDGDYAAPEWGLDSTTGLYGLKFNAAGAGLGDGGAVETHTFSFTVENDDVSSLGLGTKAGTATDASVSYDLQPKVKLGNMNTWGNAYTGPGWDFSADPGLIELPKGIDWTLAPDVISQTLTAKGFGAYTSGETDVINSSAYDASSTYYRRRTLVGLGVWRWKSGLPDGQPGGNGDETIDADEIEEIVPYPSSSENPETLCKQVGGDWEEFVEYVMNRNSRMCKYRPSQLLYGDPGLRYRYGLKTWVDYLQEEQTGETVSPGLAGSPQQPMGAVAEAIKEGLAIIHEQEGEDLAGLASYADVGYGPNDMPDNMSWLRSVEEVWQLEEMQDLIDQLQPGMWSANTNVAQGIDKGVEVLFDSPDGRANAAKVLVLLTDGIANQTRENPPEYDEAQARVDALAAAADARGRHVQLYTISVGANADQELMKQIADDEYEPGDRGEVDGHFHAEGDIETYKAQLIEIFRRLGGQRPILLIQ